MTMDSRCNVLFLCTGNSARSIMAEAILNYMGVPHFTAYSAGSHPSGTVRPEAMKPNLKAPSCRSTAPKQGLGRVREAWCAQTGFRIHRLRQRRQRSCPVWPGQPMTAHWGIPDPAAVTARRRKSKRVPRRFMILDRRIGLFLCLPLSSLDKLAIQKNIDDIGRQK